MTKDRKINQHLNQIIALQTHLTEANFNLEDFMNLVVIQMQQLTPANGVVVELVEGNDMVYRAATGTVKDHIGLRLDKNTSISGLCVKTSEILISEDTEEDPRVNLNACRLVKARSMIVAPLFHEGIAVGVIKIMASTPHAFSDEDVHLLQIMAGFIGAALAHQILHEKTEALLKERIEAFQKLKKAEEKLKYMAQHDFLTGLPNRSLLEDRLTIAIHHAKRNNKLIALFFLDIDHFKKINDTYGHDVGDALLKAFASRIVQCTRESDTVARLGGDEFVVLLNDIAHKEDATQVAKKIIDHMQADFVFQKIKLKISTSIGIAFYAKETLTGDELIKQADLALYEAKSSGRNNFKIHETDDNFFSQ